MGSKTLNWEKRQKIRNGEPIEVFFDKEKQISLTFFPVTMSHYEEFLSVRNAILLRQSAMPIEYMSMKYLSALWALEIDSVRDTGKVTGVFDGIMRMLYLTLRLEYNSDILLQTVYCSTEDPRQLQYIEVTQGDKIVQITPQMFSAYIRPLIAEQNGLTLPDESYNVDLVEEEEKIKNSQDNELECDTDTLIASVAYLSGINEMAINNWTVLQFEHRVQAIERDKRFMLYSAAELGGMVTFKKGNPCPSWCYEKRRTSVAVRAIGDVSQNVKAIGDLGAVVTAGGSTNS